MMINPDNISADKDGKFPDEVNENLPKMLTYVILIFIAMSLTAICLISPGPLASTREAANVRDLDETLVDEVISQGQPGVGI